MSQLRRGEALLLQLQRGKKLSFREQMFLTVWLSVPAMLAQISFIIMQYIDASMVGGLGADESASIGLVSTSTWLFGGLCVAATTGFTVQVAQRIGAGDERTARNLVKMAMVAGIGFSLFLTVAGAGISNRLPVWLGGDEAILKNASSYFLIYVLFLPVMQLNSLAGGMLQSSGNMKVPSILHMFMCLLDVIFNAMLIFPSRPLSAFGGQIWIPGAGLGVTGAALGTALAETVTVIAMLYFLFYKSKSLSLRKGERFYFSLQSMKSAFKIAAPVGVEQIVMCGAMVASTRIVAPLGTIAIAANSFAVTAESLCYMPGYGIEAAATTLVGQSVGAGRHDLVRRLAWLSTGLGMVIMTCSGILMYAAAPLMIGFLSPDKAIRQLGTAVLRIEAFAEPLYGASIVASGALRGAGDTLIPSCMNFFSMWAIRLPLAAWLAPVMGLKGVWIAMCLELCARGILFLIRLNSKGWLKGNKEGVVTYEV